MKKPVSPKQPDNPVRDLCQQSTAALADLAKLHPDLSGLADPWKKIDLRMDADSVATPVELRIRADTLDHVVMFMRTNSNDPNRDAKIEDARKIVRALRKLAGKP